MTLLPVGVGPSHAMRLTGLILIACLLSGCLSLQIKPRPENVAAMQNILIVPLEPPPLVLPHAVLLPESAGQPVIITESATTVASRGQLARAPGRHAMVLGGVFLLGDVTIVGQDSAEEFHTLDKIHSRPDAWVPTVILATEAQRQMAAAGKPHARLATQLYVLVDVGQRAPPWDEATWHEPIRNWYNLDHSPRDYSEYVAQGVDGVLEVGLFNFYYWPPLNRLNVHVMAKLIDPATGEVLGRARDYDASGRDFIGALLDEEGKGLKALFSDTRARVVEKNLRYLGLIPDR